jgi:hypothetical protein
MFLPAPSPPSGEPQPFCPEQPPIKSIKRDDTHACDDGATNQIGYIMAADQRRGSDHRQVKREKG